MPETSLLVVNDSWVLTVTDHVRVAEADNCVYKFGAGAHETVLGRPNLVGDYPATLLLHGCPAIRGTVQLDNGSTYDGYVGMDARFTPSKTAP